MVVGLAATLEAANIPGTMEQKEALQTHDFSLSSDVSYVLAQQAVAVYSASLFTRVVDQRAVLKHFEHAACNALQADMPAPDFTPETIDILHILGFRVASDPVLLTKLIRIIGYAMGRHLGATAPPEAGDRIEQVAFALPAELDSNGQVCPLSICAILPERLLSPVVIHLPHASSKHAPGSFTLCHMYYLLSIKPKAVWHF